MRIIATALLALSLVPLYGWKLNAEEIQLGVAPSKPAKAGFTMFVLTERLGNEGFQPITLRFQSIGKSFTRQREIRVLFRPRTQYATEMDFQFACNVTVPQGVKKYDVPVLVPCFYRWETCSVRLIEDGRTIGKLPSQLNVPPKVQDWGQRMSVGIIVPRDAATSNQAWAKFPDVRSLVTVLGEGPISNKPAIKRFNDKQARNYIDLLQSGWARFRIIDEDALRSSWLGYSQLDLILAPYPVLQRIENEQPDQLAQLQRWVTAGGQLWAYAAPSTLNPPAASSDTASPSNSRVPDSWLAGPTVGAKQEIRYLSDPKAFLMLNEINDNSMIQYQPWGNASYSTTAYNSSTADEKRKVVYDKLVAAKNPMVQTVSRNQMIKQVDVMRYGLGRVVLIKQEDPFPGSFQLWRSLEYDHQGWVERNGVDYGSGNDSYWAWLMLTVGQPPVTMFVILNGLFVLVMGPVLYFGLKRRSRLYLLYFIAPALAFVTTMGLFTYAFVSDGFGNRVRARQLTWIDGRQSVSDPATTKQQAFPILDQSRQTYYTVMDSHRGLRFDDDSLVLPVQHSPMMNNYNYYPADDYRPGDYLIDQSGDERVYGGDFLPTRTQTHFLVTRPSAGPMPLTFDFSGDKPTVTNHLPTELDHVGVCDTNGKFWIANEVAADATVTFESVRSNVLSSIALGVVDADSSNLPKPYQNRVSMNDRSGIEERILRLSRNPPRRSFMATTAVQASQFALRDCATEDCVRLIGGLIP